MTVNTQELRELVEKAHWYAVDRNDLAMLCADRDDAHREAESCAAMWPESAPYRAMQLIDAAPMPALLDEIEALRGERGVLADILRDALGPLQVDLLNAEADGDCEDSRDLRAIIDRAEAALNPPAPPQGETAC